MFKTCFVLDIIGGGFAYYDQYENELASVRWYRIKMDGPIKWKYTSFASPPDSWWMDSVVPVRGNITWGFKNLITDGSWVFRVGKCAIYDVCRCALFRLSRSTYHHRDTKIHTISFNNINMSSIGINVCSYGSGKTVYAQRCIKPGCNVRK